MKTLILFPIINNTDRKIIRINYFSPELFFPISNIPSDLGYVSVYANRVSEKPVTLADLAQLRQSKRSERLQSLLYDYAVITSFDSFQITHLTSTRKLKITILIFDVKAGKVVLKKPYYKTEWRGIIGGPLGALLELAGNETGLQDVLQVEISSALTTHLARCLKSMGVK